MFDPILLARIQFAFTISFHIIFPAFTIGLASFLAVLEYRWLKTGEKHFIELYKFWIKIFAVTFGMGVVSGVVMSYQFGTNWSVFSHKAGNILGPLLGYEVLTAFFLESSFLGIMLFGFNKVSKKMHFASTCIVAVGTLISAFWILSANSFMQTPQGFSIDSEGKLIPQNWLEIIFNPSFFYRFPHMVSAAYLTTALVVGGIGAYYLYRQKYVEHAKIMISMATLLIFIVAPIQIFIGDLHGLNTLKHQPAKIAAIEGIWENEVGAPLRLFGIPNQEKEETAYAIEIPKLASILLTHSADGEIKGLKSFAKEDRPRVSIVFFAFRIMVGIGFLMLLLGILSAVQYFRKKLFTSKFLQYYWMLMMPMGFLAILSGWFTTEVGRQPYLVYGILRTSEMASPAINSAQILWSLCAFIIIYIFIFGAATYYILKLISHGIKAHDEPYYAHSKESAALKKQ